MKLLLTIIVYFIYLFYIPGQNYLEYYSKINHAKSLIIDSNYQHAALLYYETFEEFDFEYARDCINAFEIALAIGEDSLTIYFAEQALRRGVPFSYFRNKQETQNPTSTKHWERLEKDSLFFQNEFQASINIEIRNEINTMFALDQEIRKQYYNWWNFLFRPIIDRKWKKTNLKQVNRIMEITKEYGFPGEQLIGIDLPTYHHKVNPFQFSAGMPIILFIHHYSQPNSSYDFILLEEVFNGHIHNEHFATICDFEAEFGKNKHEIMGYYGLKHHPKRYQQDDFKEKRKQIGLLSNSKFQELNKTNLITKFWNQLK